MEPFILVDAREFGPGRVTGIGRVLTGLIDALEESEVSCRIITALSSGGVLPSSLRGRRGIEAILLPEFFLHQERRLTELSGRAKLLISPYPKLPLWGCHCPCIHTVHDVLELTHPLYRRRGHVLLERWRLKRALRRADLTWFDSRGSLEETVKVAGFAGNRPEIRYPGVETVFDHRPDPRDQDILSGLRLKPGYIVTVGNGKPHKNLGVILACAAQLRREVVFVGVPARNRRCWNIAPQDTSWVRWLEDVPDDALPSLLRQAFCLAQPSTAEGYGYPPLEAMACGIPAVVSNIPVLVETTGGNALTADPHSPGEWKHAFELLEDDRLYRDRVKAGLEWAAMRKGRPAWAAYIRDIQSLISSR